jgi:Fur family transcriptional regulator, ferric uptake regulator
METEATSWADHALACLREAGYRSGGARRIVVEYLERQDCCLSAQETHDRIRAQGAKVGIASVYRVLDLLAAQGLLTRVDLGDGVARYEAARPSGHHHHHLVCGDCGKVEAFEDDELERELSLVAQRLGYAMEAHDVVLRGACDDCRDEQAATASRVSAS